jgi:hypothetical protein
MIKVKEILSPSSSYKAIIFCNDEGIYQVEVHKFTHEIVEGFGEVCDPFWERVSYMKTFAGTLKEAQKLAVENLITYSGEIIGK